jgi:hypothetical protein
MVLPAREVFVVQGGKPDQLQPDHGQACPGHRGDDRVQAERLAGRLLLRQPGLPGHARAGRRGRQPPGTRSRPVAFADPAAADTAADAAADTADADTADADTAGATAAGAPAAGAPAAGTADAHAADAHAADADAAAEPSATGALLWHLNCKHTTRNTAHCTRASEPVSILTVQS